MGQANLPLASGSAHADAFRRLGWKLHSTRRGRGKHYLLTRDGHRATLSIPDHREVKRTIIVALIKLAGVSEAEYLRAFKGETFDYWIYEDNVNHVATVHRGDCPHCNHGAGVSRGRIERVNRWLKCDGGSEREVRSVHLQPGSMLRRCVATNGPCRDDAALAWLGL